MEHRTDDVLGRGFTDQLLVCTHTHDGEYACCADADAGAVFDAATEWLRDRGVLWSSVHIAETSCLGLCSEAGTTIAIQPRNEWYSGVSPEEVPVVLADEFGDDATDLGDPDRPVDAGPTPE